LTGIVFSTQISIKAGGIICKWNFPAQFVFTFEFMALLWLLVTVFVFFTPLKLAVNIYVSIHVGMLSSPPPLTPQAIGVQLLIQPIAGR